MSGKGQTKMEDEAKDFLWTIKNGSGFDSKTVEQEFDAYIKKSLTHIVRDLIRRDLRYVQLFPVQTHDEPPHEETAEMESDIEKIEVKLNTVALFLENEELAHGLEQLTTREKMFIELDFVYEYSDADIAEYMGLLIESVYKFRYRVLRKLEGLIKGENEW